MLSFWIFGLYFITHKNYAFLSSDILTPSCHRNHNAGYGCEHSDYDIHSTTSEQPIWTHKISHAGDTDYLAIHFSNFNIPSGDRLVIRNSINNTTLVSGNTSSTTPFYSPRISDNEIILELYRDTPYTHPDAETCHGIEIDHYRCKAEMVSSSGIITNASYETVCGKDNTKEIGYLANGNNFSKAAFAASHAVARLLVHKKDYDASCTGWLVGSEGHLMTNYHCIEDDEEASNTDFEFAAQCDSFECTCSSYGACTGDYVATSSSIISKSKELDFVLLKLNATTNPTLKYGYLQMRNTSAVQGESIYVPQHPLGHGKRISMTTDSGKNTIVINTNVFQCNAYGISYAADTRGGSSGAPVLDSNHTVIALHNCGGKCSNSGIPTNKIIEYLEKENNLPQDSIWMANNNLILFVNNTYSTSKISSRNINQIVFDGTIYAGNETVSVDHILISIDEPTTLVFDVLSAELSDDAEYADVNRDLDASYIDAAMYLFDRDTGRLIFYEDDTPQQSKADGSVSVRDPYREIYLQKGTYLLAVGSVPFSPEEAILKRSKRTKYAPSIFNCREFAQAGKYRVAVSSSYLFEAQYLPAFISENHSFITKPTSSCK